MKILDLTDLKTSCSNLIEASAGTGKTWTISALYILFLLERRMRPEEILVVTYTRSATAELRERIRKRISDTLELYTTGRPPCDELEQVLLSRRCTDPELAVKLLTRALYSFDDAAIFTIHGFCQRALVEFAFESGSLFDTEMVSDQSAIVRDVCDDYWRTFILSESDPFLKRLIANGWSPLKLAEPFQGHLQNPELTIIPTVENPDLSAMTDRCVALYGPLELLWRRECESIGQLLFDANLSQTSYKPDRISAAISDVERWLGYGDCTLPCPALKLFTTDAIRKGQKKGSTVPEHAFFELCQQFYDFLLELELAYQQKLIHHQTALKSWAQRELADRKRALNLRCYDDLLLDLQRALAGSDGERLVSGLRQRYHAALIDEFQDTDPLQWQVFRHIGALAEYPLFLIGDPKQAIYSFRGADIFAYIAAGRSVEDRNRATLDTNRRSSSALVGAVNALFQSVPDPFVFGEIYFNPVRSGRDQDHNLLKNGVPLQHPLQFWVYQREDETRAVRKPEASGTIVLTVAAEIARLLDGSHELVTRHGRRRLAPSDIAVLVKAHYQADLIQAALNNCGIPSVQHGGATIFESEEARDLLRIMRAAHEPSRERLVREALLTGCMGLTANEVAGWMVGEDPDNQWDAWLLRFRKLHDAARTGGIISMAEILLDDCGLRRQCLSLTGGERILTNILQCVELLHHAEQEQSRSLESLVIWLERRITSESEDETALLRLETDENAVQISTIHASKGLEYPVVFLPFAWDPPSSRHAHTLFHDSSGTLTLDLGSENQDFNKALAKRERDAEAARLLYVALTRAEFLCYVAWGCIADAPSSPLFNLLHSSSVKDDKSFKSHPDESILADVVACGAQAPGLTAYFMPRDTPAPPYRSSDVDQQPPVCRTLQYPIASDWRVTSFTGMVAGSDRSPQPRDYDALSIPAQEPPDGESEPLSDILSIFNFPRGAGAGTCLHRIFELLDFSSVTSDHISRISRSTLLSYGYPEQWLPAVSTMVQTVVNTPLVPEVTDFCLSRLRKNEWFSELEFYLPLASISPSKICECFAGLLDPRLHGSFDTLLENLSFSQCRGMLHGFMDMVFKQGGRFYIIDWKSNHLGMGIDNYAQPYLTRSMAEHAYILQYHLYTLALDRHLRQRLPGYDYESHFGGAIYIYLRGVSVENPECGIYRDRPSAGFIRKANELLLS